MSDDTRAIAAILDEYDDMALNREECVARLAAIPEPAGCPGTEKACHATAILEDWEDETRIHSATPWPTTIRVHRDDDELVYTHADTENGWVCPVCEAGGVLTFTGPVYADTKVEQVWNLMLELAEDQDSTGLLSYRTDPPTGRLNVTIDGRRLALYADSAEQSEPVEEETDE